MPPQAESRLRRGLAQGRATPPTAARLQTLALACFDLERTVVQHPNACQT